MPNEIFAGMTSPKWGNLPSLPECLPLQELYQNVLKIQGGTSTNLKTLLKKVVSQSRPNSAGHREVLNEVIFTLAKLALNVANVADILISSMEKYEYPEGKKFQDKVYDYLYWKHHEDVLPRCDFSLEKPIINRERFVVCKQMINYFAEVISTGIFRMCQTGIFDLSQLPFKLQNFGSYLVYSEDTHTKTSGRHFSSWEIREEWDKHMKKSFCEYSDKGYRKNVLCSDDIPEDKPPQSLMHWSSELFPGAYSQGDVYSSITADEIKAELSKQNKSRRSHYGKSNQMREHFRNAFTSVADKLSHARTTSSEIKKIMDKNAMLVSLKENCDQKSSLENWKKIQALAHEMEKFLMEHNLKGQYPDIEYQIQLTFRITKPQQKVGL